MKNEELVAMLREVDADVIAGHYPMARRKLSDVIVDLEAKVEEGKKRAAARKMKTPKKKPVKKPEPAPKPALTETSGE